MFHNMIIAVDDYHTDSYYLEGLDLNTETEAAAAIVAADIAPAGDCCGTYTAAAVAAEALERLAAAPAETVPTTLPPLRGTAGTDLERTRLQQWADDYSPFPCCARRKEHQNQACAVGLKRSNLPGLKMGR